MGGLRRRGRPFFKSGVKVVRFFLKYGAPYFKVIHLRIQAAQSFHGKSLTVSSRIPALR
ncbi:MAG: hypothetical protein V1844_25150 [Pseudomonadota bacterium]